MRKNQPNSRDIIKDLSQFHSELRCHTGGRYLELLNKNIWRPLADITLDYATIAIAAAVVLNFGLWLSPISILIIANRQRALGNILHDAAHGNLHRSRAVNNALANACIAPLLFLDLEIYRDSHFRHHQRLGTPSDPDRLERAAARSWQTHYLVQLTSAHGWSNSLAGHLAAPGVPWRRQLLIVGWWLLACALLGALSGMHAVLVFTGLWVAARATVFHAITIFREMCDHYGLVEGGVVSFTRDILKTSVWHHLVHPHNNGYHLTHHLLPTVPYYCLPRAQRLFAATPLYRNACHVCDSYVFGASPAVRRWAVGANR